MRWRNFNGGYSSLIRKYPKYHHLFIGTPRCLDNLESFLIRNPDLRNNIHFVGPIKNIYRILKSIDFWVNSFPTTGGSNIEIAQLGKPTIDIAINRNLDWHPGDFLTNECIVISLDEFIDLGSKFIEDENYRNNLGKSLQQQISREFEKNRLVTDNIYKEFIKEYKRKLKNIKRMPDIKLEPVINYEKRIAIYNAYYEKNWNFLEKQKFLTETTNYYPEKTFAWIKLIELNIQHKNLNELKNLKEKINKLPIIDYRIKVCLSYGYLVHKNLDVALEIIMAILDSVGLDLVPYKLASKILYVMQDKENAFKIYKKIDQKSSFSVFNDLVSKENFINLPLYYSY